MPFETTDLIIADVLFRAAEATDGTSDFDAQVLNDVNRVYRELINGGSSFVSGLREDWWWLHNESTVTLEKVITSGTVAITENSTAINFSIAKSPSVQGWHIRFNNTGPCYKIATHTNGATAATLDSVFAGTTAGTASYELFKIDYALAADVGYIKSPMRSSEEDTITGIDETRLARDFPLSRIEGGTPQAFAQIGASTVRFSHMGSRTTLIRLDYSYRANPTDLTDSGSSTPLLPIAYRHILGDGALSLLLVNKNDIRAKAAADLARAGIMAMMAENKSRRQKTGFPEPGRIITRPNRFRPKTIRTESGMIIG